ncbi:MAG TPA: SDR family oxidoreductase [Candidatus Acidoferrum sp.]|nr:SDR family oxidoreductase [Candidatus Acidoferrum sp.]
MKRLSLRYGPWALVTGASSGIGQAIACELAKEGFNLVLVARKEDFLRKLAQELAAKWKTESRTIAADLTSTVALDTVMSATMDIDVGLLVAAAGFGTSGPFLDSPLDLELEMLTVNCASLTALTWHFGRRFAQRRRGAGIILLSSIVGFQGMPWAAHYAATKAYVQTLAEALQIELAAKGIDVLAAAPGPTESRFAERAGMRMGKALNPEEIAWPILEALGRKATVLPGLLSKLLVWSLLPLPRWARIRIMGQVMRGMTAHRPTA